MTGEESCENTNQQQDQIDVHGVISHGLGFEFAETGPSEGCISAHGEGEPETIGILRFMKHEFGRFSSRQRLESLVNKPTVHESALVTKFKNSSSPTILMALPLALKDCARRSWSK